ncbi:MAG: DUF4388 domain-containing protein [Firmicutes bacterium]|nr:DUF4388 domain-containing protein [Bacillota bacterium]
MSQGLIQGSMREAPLPDIIQLVSQGGKSGCFHVVEEARRAKIYLKDGKLVHALSPDAQGIEVIFDVALWLDGTYYFEEGVVEVEPTITKSNAAVLMEMHRRMDEWRVVSQKIGSPDLYPTSTLLPGETAQGVNPRQTNLLNLATGWYSVAELGAVLQKPVLNVAKDLYDLVMAGYVVMKGVRSGRKPEGLESAAPPPQPPPPPAPVAVTPPEPQGFPVVTERLEPVLQTVPAPPPVEAPAAETPAPVRPIVGGSVTDPVKIGKLNAYCQRIATTARGVLPPQHHAMVNTLLAEAIQRVNAGEGPDAVKGMALAVSKGAVEAGCDGETMKNLNAQIKAIFAK